MGVQQQAAARLGGQSLRGSSEGGGPLPVLPLQPRAHPKFRVQSCRQPPLHLHLLSHLQRLRSCFDDSCSGCSC